MLGVLAPHIREGIPVVGVEPSCIAAFRDELPGLMPHDEDAKRLSLQTLTLAEFLGQRASDWEPPRLQARALVHGHCHHEAVMGMSAEKELYERLGLEFEILDSGCCGLAGSFGFEKGHDRISREIGEQRLMPAVRSAPEEAILIADGFSCKTQIEQMTERRALHTAQVVKMAMERSTAPGPLPERGFPDVELDGFGGRREAAVVGAALAAGAGILAGTTLSRRLRR
jgi:Fe-S oxidoreductase